MSLRAALHRQLDPRARPRGLSPLNLLLSVAIVVAVGAAVAETEPTVAVGHEALFASLEAGFLLLFSAEFLLRLWTAAEEARPGESGWRARGRYLVSAAALFDLLAILPALVTLAPGLIGGTQGLFVLRLVRLLRIARLAKLNRVSDAEEILARVIWSRRYELGATLMIGAALLLVVSTLMYLVEGVAQPEAFGSIPRALWWGVVTLTTIGYGDVYPRTGLGRLLAGVTAVCGIGLVAAPTGILAAGFSEALHHARPTRPDPD